MERGRPTTYKSEYCQKLVKHMAEGYSFETFACEVGSHRDTLYAWAKVHPEFAEAKSIGTAWALQFWIGLGRDGILGKIPHFSSRTWIFTMRNRFGWSSKGCTQEQDTCSGNGGFYWNPNVEVQFPNGVDFHNHVDLTQPEFIPMVEPNLNEMPPLTEIFDLNLSQLMKEQEAALKHCLDADNF